MIVNAQLSMAGHTSTVTELVFRAEDAYRTFSEQVADEFVSRLAMFEANDAIGDDTSIVLAGDVEAILV